MKLIANVIVLSKRALVLLVCICFAVPSFANPVPRSIKQEPNLPFLPPNKTLLNSSTLYPFRDAYDYAPHGYSELRAVLAVPRTRLRQVQQGADPSGEQFVVDIRLYNDSGETRNLYNLDWNPFVPMPGRLVLCDAQKHYVCDLLERMGGSRTTITVHDWADLPASSYIGKILYESLPYPTYKVLPAGTYYLQVIYLPRLVQAFSETNTPRFNYDDHTELFRSNAVPVMVVGQVSAKPFMRLPMR